MAELFETLTPIGKIDDAREDIIITARVTNKSSVREWGNQLRQGTRIFFECLDGTGEIRCTGFNEKAAELSEKLNIGSIYTFTRLRSEMISENDKKKFQLAIQHDFQLVLDANGEIEGPLDINVPYRKYDFLDLAQLRQALVLADQKVDAIGVCDCFGDLYDKTHHHNASGQYGRGEEMLKPCRDLWLVDRSTGPDPKDGIKLTLEGQQALEWAPTTPCIIVLKRGRMWDGALISGDTNMIEINPFLPECGELIKWYAELLRAV